MIMLVDTHTHLGQDPTASLSRAQSAGVGLVFAAATDVASSRRNVYLAEKFSQVKACVGIHPWHADLFTPEAENALGNLIGGGNVAAISETGIDMVHRRSDDLRSELPPLPLEVQAKAFQSQVKLAVANNLLLILHDRNSTGEILRALDTFQDQMPKGIAHGFNGTIDEARQYRQRGFLISINKRNLPAINPVVEALTLDDIVLETDSHEPAQVIEVCQAVALLKKVSVGEIEAATTENVMKLL
jgi:TatD DNase family protein